MKARRRAPRGSAEVLRHVVMVRLTDAQHRALTAWAKARRLTIGEAGRAILAEAVGGKPTAP